MKKSVKIILSATALILLITIAVGLGVIIKHIPIVGEYKETESFSDDSGEKTISVSVADIKNSEPLKYSIKITAKSGMSSAHMKTSVVDVCDYSVYWIDDKTAVLCETSDGYMHSIMIVDFENKISITDDSNTEKVQDFDITSKGGFVTIFKSTEQLCASVVETEDSLLYVFGMNDPQKYYTSEQDNLESYMQFNSNGITEVGFRKNGEEKFTGTMQFYDERIVVVTIDKKYEEIFIK